MIFTEVFVASISTSKFHQIPEVVWERLEPLLPKYKRSPKGGKPRLLLRKVANGIFYVLVTGCQWKAMPREFGSGSAIHAYFQEWVELGVFQKLWSVALEEYDDLKGIDWEWQSLDGAMNKSPLGGEKNWKKSNRSGQDRGQAFGADRWSRRPHRGGGGWSQCA